MCVCVKLAKCICKVKLSKEMKQRYCFFDATIPFFLRCRSTTEKNKIISTGFATNEHNLKKNVRCVHLFPTSLAVTEGILVSFFFCAALTDMFKFSAYTRLSWCAINLKCQINKNDIQRTAKAQQPIQSKMQWSKLHGKNCVAFLKAQQLYTNYWF